MQQTHFERGCANRQKILQGGRFCWYWENRWRKIDTSLWNAMMELKDIPGMSSIFRTPRLGPSNLNKVGVILRSSKCVWKNGTTRHLRWWRFLYERWACQKRVTNPAVRHNFCSRGQISFLRPFFDFLVKTTRGMSFVFFCKTSKHACLTSQ